MIQKKILGIVAEYDPFHNGHALHLERARKIISPDAVYTVLSPCLKQRGTLSLLSPFDRASCAVHAGSDAVFALPVLWTVRDAEHYAFGAVSLLNRLGVTHMSFGAETDDTDILMRTAALLENPSSVFSYELKAHLESGEGYPSSLSAAADKCIPGSSRVLSFPNNTLAVCYLRALRRLNSAIRPVIIPRAGNDHNLFLDPFSPSATALRGFLLRGAYSQAEQAVPPFSARVLQKAFLEGRVPDLNIWNAMLSEKLLFSDLSKLPDLSEGIEFRIRKLLSVSADPVDLAGRITGRRYTSARISRIFAMLMLGVDRQCIDTLPQPDVVLLLAIRKRSALSERWHDLPVRIFSSPAEWRSHAANEDLAAWRLWGTSCRLPDSLPYSEKIYTE